MHVRPKVVVIAVLVVLLLGATIFLLSPSLSGHDYLKAFFLQQIEDSLGRKIDVHRVKFVIFPSIRLELSQVAIHDRDSDHLLLSAKRIDLVLRLLPLLRKQVVGKRLLIEEPQLELRRNPAGEWNLPTPSQDGSSREDATARMMGQILRVREASIVNGRVLIEDESRPGGARTLHFEAVQGSLKILPERLQADLHLSANIAGGAGLSALSLTGTVEQAQSSPTLTDDLTRPNTPRVQFEGTMEAANLGMRDVADFFGPRPVPEGLAGSADLKSHVQIVPGVAGYDVVLSEIIATVDRLHLTGHANLSGLLTTQPTFSITFSSSEVDLKDLLTRIPGQWIHPQLPAIITDRQIAGSVRVTTATLTGSAIPSPQLLLTGEFLIQKGQALVGDDHIPTKDLSTTVFVEAGRIRITNLTGQYGAIHISQGKAMVSFLEAGPWLELEVGGNMAAVDLVSFLSRTIRSERLTKFFADSRDVHGVALPTFRLVGPLNQPGGVTFVGGEIVARNISLNNPSLPDQVTALQGRFVLNQSGSQFDKVTGYLGDSQFQLNGAISGGRDSRFQDFVASVRGDAGHLTRLLPPGTVPNGVLQGSIAATVTLSGLTATPHIRGDLVLTESAWSLPGVAEKPAGAPATVQLEGDLVQPNALTITQLDLVMPSIHLTAKGKIQLGPRFSIDASLATGPVSLSAVPEWIAKGGLEAGNLEVSLDFKGAERDWKTWKITGWVALSNGLMLAKGLDGHLQDLYVRMKLVRNGADLKRLAFRIKDSDVSMSGTIKNWSTKPLLTMKIESSQMDIDLLIPKGERSPVREFLETLAATSRVSATATIDRGQYKQLRLGNLSCRVTIENGVLDVDRINGQTESGQMAGRIVVQLPKLAPAETEASVRLTGVPLHEILPLLGTRDAWITGTVRLNGTLRAHGRNPHGVFPTLGGQTNLLIENGRIFKSDKRPIWKVISILNLPAVLQGKVDLEKDGLPFTKLSATITVRNGLIESENLVLDSPVLKITAAGNYDLPTDQVNMVWAVSPFGSYSQFLKTIPLFGRLFAGERKGIATALFQVKGSLEDTDVTYLPMKSFTAGLTGLAQLAFDVLKNTVTLPIDLMTPGEDKITSEPASPSDIPAPASP